MIGAEAFPPCIPEMDIVLAAEMVKKVTVKRSVIILHCYPDALLISVFIFKSLSIDETHKSYTRGDCQETSISSASPTLVSSMLLLLKLVCDCLPLVSGGSA